MPVKDLAQEVMVCAKQSPQTAEHYLSPREEMGPWPPFPSVGVPSSPLGTLKSVWGMGTTSPPQRHCSHRDILQGGGWQLVLVKQVGQ